MTQDCARRTVTMGSVRCEWTCAPGALEQFFTPAAASPRVGGSCLFDVATPPFAIVTDENVDRLHGPELPRDVPRLVLPPGEASKCLASLGDLLRLMLDAGLDRGGTVIAFGGGVIGDLAGFAAATFMRGVRWIDLPTTVLSMVDASIGGKTGVDVNGVKNLAGAFHPPVAVVADPLVLATLPRRERMAGMAEVVKQAIIGSRPLFERLEDGVFDDVQDVAAAARVKIEVVQRDPFERGERAVLNLGHTIGHGIESASRFQLSHGEAVAVGLVAEARMAEAIGLAPRGLPARITAALDRFGLPARASLDPGAVRDAMQSDKKRSAGRLKFALPRQVGDVVYGVEVEEAVLMEVLRETCAG